MAVSARAGSIWQSTLLVPPMAGPGIGQASAVVPITLGIPPGGSQVTLHHTAGTLGWANDPGRGWTPVPGASAPSFTTPATLKKFFQVRWRAVRNGGMWALWRPHPSPEFDTADDENLENRTPWNEDAA